MPITNILQSYWQLIFKKQMFHLLEFIHNSHMIVAFKSNQQAHDRFLMKMEVSAFELRHMQQIISSISFTTIRINRTCTQIYVLHLRYRVQILFDAFMQQNKH